MKRKISIKRQKEKDYKGEEFDDIVVFMSMAPQSGQQDAAGNPTFLWKEKKITVSLGETDVGEILAVLRGWKNEVGTKGCLYHESPKGGSKMINFSKGQNGGFYLQVSHKDKEGNKHGPYSVILSDADSVLLLVLLEKVILEMYGW